jgi:hypothetical protein
MNELRIEAASQTLAETPQEWLAGHASGIADRNGEVSLLNATIRELSALLSEGLDLCVRARKLDKPVIATQEEWAKNPSITRSATPALWVQDQYDTDLADWETRARNALQ